MTPQMLDEKPATTFGRRKVTPRACVADSKKHLRAFLTEVLEDLGFVTCECAKADELGTILETQFPDLVVLGLSVDGIEAGKMLENLVRGNFGGQVLIIGARESVMVKAVQQVGEEYGITMLQPLTTPFAAGSLRERIAALLPDEPAPSPAVNVSEALHAGFATAMGQALVLPAVVLLIGLVAVLMFARPRHLSRPSTAEVAAPVLPVVK